MPAPLANVRVLDLSRILAGPWCTQLLADLGAEVIKIERPGKGDDTRGWGPPFIPDPGGKGNPDAAYFQCTNRGKKSVAIDLARPQGQALIRELAAGCDVLLENFKVGDLARYGLGYEDLIEARRTVKLLETLRKKKHNAHKRETEKHLEAQASEFYLAKRIRDRR
jgi:crotonobetainyl-CoA:carnitine CoA-transferase CaiB-like acyl-CoA transferase